MKSCLFFLLFIFLVGFTNAQDITIPVNSANFNVASPQALSSRNLKEVEKNKFSKKTDDKIIIQFTGIPAGKTLKVNDEAIDLTNKTFDITDDVRDLISKNKVEKRTYEFKLFDAAHPLGQVCGSVNVTWTKSTKTPVKEVNSKTLANRKKIIDKFKGAESYSNPYDSKNDKVDLYFDENGRLLNFLPVGIDQSDTFSLHILCIKGDEEKYGIKIVQGDFSPNDLNVRTGEKLSATVGQSEENEEKESAPLEYSFTTLHAGPFTSDFFKFQISYDSVGQVAFGPEYKLKINKLWHLGVGVSILKSNLEAPEYKTYFNGTDTTIQSFNGGSRILFTFNVIWYWTIFHQKKTGSNIPNGRDVLKDEPSFSITRLYPTIGVTIDNSYKENFFIGGVYEFARGGSITVGMHYGRVNVLKDQNFEIGKTKFSGTDADIKLDKVYKSGFYIGLNIDNRILNLLFSKGQ